MWRSRWYYKLRNITSGKLYLGQTIQDIETYRGSGVYWKSHCRKNGGYNCENIEVVWKKFFTEEKEAQIFLDDFKREEGEYWLFENNKWANRVPETTDDSVFTNSSKLIQNDLVARGIHHLQSGEIQSRSNAKRVKEGTHNFQEQSHKDNLREIQSQLVKEGKHILQDLNLKRRVNEKRVRDGTHNFLGVTCRNRSGKVLSVTKEVYYAQVGEMSDWEYVAIQSKEAKKRKVDEKV